MVNSTLKFTMTVLGAVPPIQQFEPLKWVYRFIFIYATRNFFRAFFVNNIIGSQPKKQQQNQMSFYSELKLITAITLIDVKIDTKLLLGERNFRTNYRKKIGEKNQHQKCHSTPLNLVIKTTLHFIHGWNTHYCAMPYTFN